MAKGSGFPFVKFVSSEDMVGTSLPFKIQYIVKAFEDAYKSKQSIIILDDLERLVEYVEIGRRFNNDLL
jgi:vesicle-fusing ATPase